MRSEGASRKELPCSTYRKKTEGAERRPKTAVALGRPIVRNPDVLVLDVSLES